MSYLGIKYNRNERPSDVLNAIQVSYAITKAPTLLLQDRELKLGSLADALLTRHPIFPPQLEKIALRAKRASARPREATL